MQSNNTKNDKRCGTQKTQEFEQEMTKWQQSIARVSKKNTQNIKDIKLNMNILWAIGGTKTLRVEGIGYDVGGHQ
jgi:hypothetical protein